MLVHSCLKMYHCFLYNDHNNFLHKIKASLASFEILLNAYQFIGVMRVSLNVKCKYYLIKYLLNKSFNVR